MAGIIHRWLNVLEDTARCFCKALQAVDGLRGRRNCDRSLEFTTVYLFYDVLVARERKKERVPFFATSASDLELISHGPLLEFHTPESSHDPGLAA